MSGKNMVLVLIAVLAAVVVYALVSGPEDVSVVPVAAPAMVAPPPTMGSSARTSPDAGQSAEPAPVLDEVASDAAAEVEKLKKEQDEMNDKPAAPPEMER